MPVVVALHGAGGSENLFFEGYGAGHIVTECRKRGCRPIVERGTDRPARPVGGQTLQGGAALVKRATAHIHAVQPQHIECDKRHRRLRQPV